MTLDDAHDILGIARSASAADARRAYVRLLKAHPPERDPESFKRIRAAFDLLRALDGRAEDEPRAELRGQDVAGVSQTAAVVSPGPHLPMAPGSAPQATASPPPHAPTTHEASGRPPLHAPPAPPHPAPAAGANWLAESCALLEAGQPQQATRVALEHIGEERDRLAYSPSFTWQATELTLRLLASGHPDEAAAVFAAARAAGLATTRDLRTLGTAELVTVHAAVSPKLTVALATALRENDPAAVHALTQGITPEQLENMRTDLAGAPLLQRTFLPTLAKSSHRRVFWQAGFTIAIVVLGYVVRSYERSAPPPTAPTQAEIASQHEQGVRARLRESCARAMPLLCDGAVRWQGAATCADAVRALREMTAVYDGAASTGALTADDRVVYETVLRETRAVCPNMLGSRGPR